MTRAEITSQTLNRMSHPRAPVLPLKTCRWLPISRRIKASILPIAREAPHGAHLHPGSPRPSHTDPRLLNSLVIRISAPMLPLPRSLPRPPLQSSQALAVTTSCRLKALILLPASWLAHSAPRHPRENVDIIRPVLFRAVLPAHGRRPANPC